MKKILVALTALSLSATLAYAHEGGDLKAACADDIAATGCTAEGKEQFKCMREFKKANKDFKFSDGCKSARKELREERKEKREAKKEELKKTN